MTEDPFALIAAERLALADLVDLVDLVASTSPPALAARAG
jgi:hypothetical protein